MMASNGVNVLALGSDRSLLNIAGESAQRHTAYGKAFDEFNIIVLSRGAQEKAHTLLSANVHVYLTQSRSRLLYGVDAYRIARKVSRPDVVSVQDPFEIGLIGWVIARTRGARFHVQIHTDLFAPSFRTGILNRIRYHLARFVLKRADRVRVVSNRIKEGIEKNNLTSAPVSVIPIYIDIKRFQAAHAGILAGRFSKFSKRLLVVARLEKEKNVQRAIRSFAHVRDHTVCLIVVGEGREQKNLEKLASQLGIASRVFFEGKTDPLPYYAFTDLLLVTSLYEGYGLVIVEALAAGKPVLSTDVGVAREAGAYVIDQAHFADALKEWLEKGERTGTLHDYPYASFEEYVEKYCADIAGAATQKTSQKS